MTKFAIALVAAVALALPALSLAGDKLSDSPAKPNSFIPHPHAKRHVYGAPIQPAIVGAKAAHHNHVPKKPPSGDPAAIPP